MYAMLVATLETVTLQQRTDTTFAVQPGVRLELMDVAGDVKVQAWDKQAIRISANHGSRDYLDITVSAVAIGVRGRSRRGQEAMVDYEIWVPAATPLEVSGPEAEITVDGLKADITAETVDGAITVHGGSGYISLKSTEGAVTLDGAKGRIQVNSVNGGITLTNVAGEVSAENVDGDITLDGVDATQVDVNTVDGHIIYRGAIKDGGSYAFTTHDGDLDVIVPDLVNAQVSVATKEGEFETSFPATMPDKKRKRFSFTVGNGGAKLELESFEGHIALTKGTTIKRHEDREEP